MPAVSEVGAIVYNGVRFSAFAETLEFRATPVYDRAGRTVVHTVFSITVRDRVAGRPSDVAVERMMSALLIPSAGLIYNGRGLGGVRINLGQVKDYLWGPKPRMILVKPLGGSNAVRFDWQVEFATLNCGDARYEGPAEFNYKLAFDVDESGYTRRTYSGHLRIAQTRRSVTDRVVRDSADRFREDVSPPQVEGYRRIPGVFQLSEDKNRLDFTIVDEQLPPNVPPPGVVRAAVNHDFSTPKLLAGSWTGTLGGEYEVARGYSPSVAVRAWEATLRDRLAELQKVTPRPSVIPGQFTVGEGNLYGKTTVRISGSYLVVTATLPDILGKAGLWMPVPKAFNTWKAWSESLDLSLSPRGLSGLAFRPGDDKILDLCAAVPVDAELRTDPPTFDRELKTGPPLPTARELRSAFPPPSPGTSWLHYRAWLKVEDDHGNVVGKLLPDAPIERRRRGGGGTWDADLSTLPDKPSPTPFPPASNYQFDAGGRLAADGPDTFVQQRVSPTLYVTLYGEAVRAFYPVPVPELVAIGGKPLTPVNRPDMGEGFTTGIIADGGYPLVGARWALRYVLTEVPRGPVPVLPNPLLGAF